MKQRGISISLPFALVLLPTFATANVLEIEIPSWITDSMLINGDPAACLTAYDSDHSSAQNESMPSDTVQAYPYFLTQSVHTPKNDSSSVKSRDVGITINGKEVILTGKGEVEVYGASGRLLGRFRVEGEKRLHLKAGVYMFRVNGKMRKGIVR